MAEKSKDPSPLSAVIGLLVIVVIIIAGLLLLNQLETDPSTDEAPVPTPTPTQSRISLVVEDLEPLDAGVYAVWADRSNETLYIGSFNTTSMGDFESVENFVVEGSDLITEQDLAEISRLFITVEGTGGNYTLASMGPVILDADMEEGIGALVSPLANLTGFAGEYVIATPTDGPNTNETSGIWLLHRNDDATESVGMTLPALPEGWIYFAEVRHQGIPLFVGAFEEAVGVDIFGGYSGEDPAPPFPGEDFLNNSPTTQFDFPINLTDGSTDVYIYISSKAIDSVPVNGLTIYTPVVNYTVLNGTIPVDAATLTNYPLTPQEPTYPAGIVVIR